MATFDFDHAPERLGTRCVKWDSIGEGELPMWVADMDFEVAPAIRQAVERRAAHPVYGYTFTDDSYYDAVINWFDRRHQWHIDRSWILRAVDFYVDAHMYSPFCLQISSNHSVGAVRKRFFQ